MPLSPDQEQKQDARVERELADEILATHRPRSQTAGGDTVPLTEHRVCTWCVVTWPCPRARWSKKRIPAAPTKPDQAPEPA